MHDVIQLHALAIPYLNTRKMHTFHHQLLAFKKFKNTYIFENVKYLFKFE